MHVALRYVNGMLVVDPVIKRVALLCFLGKVSEPVAAYLALMHAHYTLCPEKGVRSI